MAKETKAPFENIREAGELSAMGLTLVFATVIGYYLGYLIERRWSGLAPWGGLSGALIGITAGFLEMARTLRRISRRMEQKKEAKPERDRFNS